MAVNPLGSSPYNRYVDLSRFKSGAQTAQAEQAAASGECQTCQERTYRCGDGSAENISASTSSAQVIAHEKQHLTEQNSAASRKDMEVAQTDIKIKYSRCPECGRAYASGGEATTTMKSKPDQTSEGLGALLDLEA